ncbi:MAG: hypothetical protein ACK4RZ_15715, partial [Paracoccaceae bacterium]
MIGFDLGLKQGTSLAMTPVLREAIGFMVMSNIDLSARLADLAIAGALVKVTSGAEAYDWFSLVRQIGPPASRRHGQLPNVHCGPGGFDAERLPLADVGLLAHVEAQLELLVRDREDRRIAQSFLFALEPSGWLSASLAEIAADAGCSVTRAEKVLRQLQTAEPTGLFARSLAECLELQAEEQGHLTPAFSAMLRNLPLLGAGKTEALAEACGCDADMVLDMARTLRRMNPKPGAAFSEPSVVGRPCDLILHRDDNGWLLELNAQTVPALHLDTGKDSSPRAVQEARALIQAVERRHATVLKIATEIIERQDGFLSGHGALAALSINDLAAATGLHRSTISRVTAAMTMSMPNRTLGLRALLCAAAPAARRLDGPLSVQAVLELMRELVAKEDASNPLTDEAVAKCLLPEGAALARRTVAKYRKLA